MEEWKDIPGYEGLYQVSNLGRVKRFARNTREGYRTMKIRERYLIPHLNSNGYYRLSISVNKKSKKVYLHQLVAKSFIENPDNKPNVNHKNNIHTDNRVCNLEWVTQSENIQHYWNNYEVDGHRKAIGIMGKSVLEEHRKRNPVRQIDLNTKNVIATYPSSLEAQRQTGIDNTSIFRVIKGQRITAGGYYWELIS